MNYNKFQILEFQLKNMVINPSIVMIAKRGSGKSFITRDIIYHFRNIPGGVIIAPTDKMNSFYKFFFPDLYIHYEIKDDLFKKILARQGFMIDKQNEKDNKKNINPQSILIMDDCLADKKSWANDNCIREILMNGRHYQLTYVLTMQTPLGIGPDLRLNFDYVFLLKEDSTTNKRKLYDNYASMFPSLDIFQKVFSKCTEDFRSMVIDNRKPTEKIQEKVFWFKAASEREFIFGSKKFKEIHENYYDPNFLRRLNQQLINGNSFMNRKKKNDLDIMIDLK